MAIGLLALALAACGGNGNGGNRDNTTDTSSLGATGDLRVEAVLTNPNLDPDYIYQDPLNIQANDNVTFQLVSYSGSGDSVTRNVVPTQASVDGGVTFTTTDTTSVGGSLSITDGLFTAANTDSGTRQYILTANYQGNAYNVQYRVNPRLNQARVRGRVVDENGGGVYNALVEFYEPRNPMDTTSRQILVSRVRTAIDGTFRASVPVASTTGTLDISTPDDLTPPAITYTVNPPTGYGNTFSAPTLGRDGAYTIGTFQVGDRFSPNGDPTQPTAALLTERFYDANGFDTDNPNIATLRSGDLYLERLGGPIVLSNP